jgi:secreted Zn-dependent insulinase-like peptidase
VLQILDEPLYNALRTEQQLGYSVGASPTITAGVLGFLVSVTSDRTPAEVRTWQSRFRSHVMCMLLTSDGELENFCNLVLRKLSSLSRCRHFHAMDHIVGRPHF